MSGTRLPWPKYWQGLASGEVTCLNCGARHMPCLNSKGGLRCMRPAEHTGRCSTWCTHRKHTPLMKRAIERFHRKARELHGTEPKNSEEAPDV